MRRRVVVEPAAVDLTPTIDVVFNLIIFFMIASELNERTLELLALPRADQARPRAPSRERNLQLNVLASGAVRARGVNLSDPAAFLELEAAGYDREAPEPGQTGTPPSALRVTIRADRDTRMAAVHRVLDACVKSGVYRTSIAAEPGPQ